MAETASVQQANGTDSGNNQERTFTQAEVNEMAGSIRNKERAKYADYESLKEKAALYDQMEEANKSELQKATERADALQKQLDDLTKANQLRDVRTKVSSETGVPSDLLTGIDEETCKQQAEAILAFKNANASPKYPDVKDSGEIHGQNSSSASGDSFESWFEENFR